jgi:hypothetical protein
MTQFKECSSCDKQIPLSATVCFRCKRDQRFVIRNASLLTLLASCLLLLLSFLQFQIGGLDQRARSNRTHARQFVEISTRLKWAANLRDLTDREFNAAKDRFAVGEITPSDLAGVEGQLAARELEYQALLVQGKWLALQLQMPFAY